MKLTFGKYRGRELSTIPVSYLRWLDSKGIRNAILAHEVSLQLRRRSERVEEANARARQVDAKPREREPEREQQESSPRELAGRIVKAGAEVARRHGTSEDDIDAALACLRKGLKGDNRGN